MLTMYLSELRVWNFRMFGSKPNPEGPEKPALPGLRLCFNRGMNLVVGENDSGKTAIIDAIKLVILTQSHEYVRLEYEDFHITSGKSTDVNGRVKVYQFWA